MPIPYVPLDARGWRMAMGLRPLDISRWLEIDEHRSEELALKTQLLADKPEVVVATRPAGDDASAELQREVLAWLGAYAPHVELRADSRDHPIVAAARLVQEDLCVLVRDDVWRLQAACVCFPSRWQLASKIGRTLDQIHAPIPGYQENLSGPTNGVFDRLSPDKAFWRLNWTVIDDATLHQPDGPRQLPREEIDQWFFRVERQTIRRLRDTGAIVFTIHNYVASVNELRGTPEFTEHLLLGIDGAPAEMQEYKGWVGVAQQLREVLA
jgi:hypothetical protein